MGYPGQDRYREAARQMGILDNVTFTGALPYEMAPTYLALGDVAVSPKMSATEGNGKLLNYMAVGLPTVTFDTPVSRELLGDLGLYAPWGTWTLWPSGWTRPWETLTFPAAWGRACAGG